MSYNEPQGNAYGTNPGGGPVGGPAYNSGPVGPAEDPGKTMGIVGLVLAFLCSLVGLIVSILAYNKSKAAGFKNTPALIGMIVAGISLVLGVIMYATGGMNAYVTTP